MKKLIAIILVIVTLATMLIGCGESKPVNDEIEEILEELSSKETALQKTRIDITMDNWDTYFELKEITEVTTASNNEDFIQSYWHFSLKEGYVIADFGTDVTVTLGYDYARYEATEDFENEAIVWGNRIGEVEHHETEKEIKYADAPVFSDFYVFHNEKSKWENVEVIDIQGMLFIME